MIFSQRQCLILGQMDIDVWVTEKSAGTAKPMAVPEENSGPPTISEGGTGPDRDAFAVLRAEVAACTRCPLHRSRTQTVFGNGPTPADWMLIGEAPGAEEDRQGAPFVGTAGKLLSAMLQAIGIRREEVFIANILKCRPPENRNPKPEEAAACRDYLQAQLTTVQPRIILALGRIAAQNLLDTQTPVGKLRGRPHQYHCQQRDIPLVVTWHPAYLLRKPIAKSQAWNDLVLALHVAESMT